MKKALQFIILLFLLGSCSPHVSEIKRLSGQIETEFGEPTSTHIFDKTGSGIDWNPYTHTMIYEQVPEEEALRFLNWLKEQLGEPAPTYSTTTNPTVTMWNKYQMSFALEIFFKEYKKGNLRELQIVIREKP